MLINFGADQVSFHIESIDIACPGRESLINYTSNMFALQDQSMLILYGLAENTIGRIVIISLFNEKTILIMTAGLIVLVLIYFPFASLGRFPQVKDSSI